MRTTHLCLTLRGNDVSPGIDTTDGLVTFSPEWGMTRRDAGLLATSAQEPLGQHVYVVLVENSVVLVPSSSSDPPGRELVLVQQYNPGSGAKRWPGFWVEFGDETKQLSTASTRGGSGCETWVLCSAPLGWAQNIAVQFQNYRGAGSQTIGYQQEEAQEEPPGPSGEGREIAEAISRLCGDEGLRIIEKELAAPYGRARRQEALIDAIPGIENEPACDRLVYARSAAELNRLLAAAADALGIAQEQ